MEIYINNELVLEDVTLNATTYESTEPIEVSGIFHLKVLDGEETVEEKERAILTACYKDGEHYNICFGEVNEQEYTQVKQQSQIDYLAMMLDIDLDEG